MHVNGNDSVHILHVRPLNLHCFRGVQAVENDFILVMRAVLLDDRQGLAALAFVLHNHKIARFDRMTGTDKHSVGGMQPGNH